MKKRKKEDKNDDNKEKKKKKTAKTKCKFRGEEFLGPQASLRITPIAWFEPATSMTSLALVARLRLPPDHLETASYISINCRCSEF